MIRGNVEPGVRTGHLGADNRRTRPTGLTMAIRVNPANPKGIVWLASYPKSGNTWIRAVLHVLSHARLGVPVNQIDINQLLGGTDRALHLFDKYLNGPIETAPESEIAAARLRIQADIANDANSIVLMKTHNALENEGRYPLINLGVSVGAVYVVRNPLDVAISFAHHNNITISAAIESMARPRLRMGDEKVVPDITGTWSEHVRSWTERPNPVVHVVRHEDLLADPTTAFGAIARHVLMRPTVEQLHHAIALASFDRLKEAEQTVGFDEKPESAQRFFREGRAGQWREALSPAQVRQIVADHRDQMLRFGYLPD